MSLYQSRQSGFTHTLTFKQSIVRGFKYYKNTVLMVIAKTVGRRESGPQLKSQCRGFSLVEMIVALGLFSVVVTISVGALLMLINSNTQLQKEQSVMSNLSFALDSMTREIRTGTYYHCAERPNYTAGGADAIFGGSDTNHEDLVFSTKDCPSGSNQQLQGISFIEGGNSVTGTDTRILYFFDTAANKIFRKVGNNAPQSIVSSGIHIEDAEFFVAGSDPQTDLDDVQPVVTIIIKARESDNTNSKEHIIQTTITQRNLDI